MQEMLLIELLTEELPPKALKKLSHAFAQGVFNSLKNYDLLTEGSDFKVFATPRRLALQVSSVRQEAPQQVFREKLMPTKIGLTQEGQASAALVKKLSAKGLAHLTVSELLVEHDGKQDCFWAQGTRAGAVLSEVINAVLEQAVSGLPIPKVMSYQLSNGQSVKFVRPVHGLMVLWGEQLIPAQILGVHSKSMTLGHRFLSQGFVQISQAGDYENALEKAYVIASYEKRRQMILDQLTQESNRLNATIQDNQEVQALLDEVCALVEYPRVYPAQFEETFLNVPQECLILTMRLNQKYFPLFDLKTGRLIPHFLIVSNMDIEDPHHIIQGNERVVRPRLSDAQFFFETDRKILLEDRLVRLSKMVYHNQLGTQLNRVQRLEWIAQEVAKTLVQCCADLSNMNLVQKAKEAAHLSKADLATEMVGEFPELQGIMGAYYARFEGVSEDVSYALSQQYKVRFEPLSDKTLDQKDLVAACLFMADRLDILVGIWGIGLQPTGERDPFGLRRAALGLISVVEYLKTVGVLTPCSSLDLPLLLEKVQKCISETAYEVENQKVCPHLKDETAQEVMMFIYERLRNQLFVQYDKTLVEAVLVRKPMIEEVSDRLQALKSFMTLSQAPVLIGGYKRIANFLKKVDSVMQGVDERLFEVDSERELYTLLQQEASMLQALYQKGDYAAYLIQLSEFAPAIDRFFDHVMVLVQDQAVRNNRLSLLSQLEYYMTLVADLSCLE